MNNKNKSKAIAKIIVVTNVVFVFFSFSVKWIDQAGFFFSAGLVTLLNFTKVLSLILGICLLIYFNYNYKRNLFATWKDFAPLIGSLLMFEYSYFVALLLSKV